MKRIDPVWLALAIAGTLLIFAGLALAFTPKELVEGRAIHFDCSGDSGKCTLAKDDLAFLIAQNQFFGGAAKEFYQKLRQCQSVNLERES